MKGIFYLMHQNVITKIVLMNKQMQLKIKASEFQLIISPEFNLPGTKR